MRLAKICGPRPTAPLLLWPQAVLAPTEWVWTHGFPMPVQRVVRAGWVDVGPDPQWAAVGQWIENETFLEGSEAC